MEASIEAILAKLVSIENRVANIELGDSSKSKTKSNVGKTREPTGDKASKNKGSKARYNRRAKDNKDANKGDKGVNTGVSQTRVSDNKKQNNKAVVNKDSTPAVTEKSENKEFAEIAKKMYKYVQVAKAMLGWSDNVPKSLTAEVDSLFNSITLPLADESFNGKKNKLMEETKAAILCLASDHLRQKHELLKTELKQANPLDKERAGKLASSYSTKQFGKRLPEQLLQEKVAEAISLVGTSSNETETEIVITGPTQTPSTPRGRSESATPRNVTHSVSSSPEPQIKKGKFLTEAPEKSADDNTGVSAMDTTYVKDENEAIDLSQPGQAERIAKFAIDSVLAGLKEAGFIPSPSAEDDEDDDGHTPRDEITTKVNKATEEEKETIVRRVQGVKNKLKTLDQRYKDINAEYLDLLSKNTTTTKEVEAMERKKHTFSDNYKTKKSHIKWLESNIQKRRDDKKGVIEKQDELKKILKELGPMYDVITEQSKNN